MPLSSTGESWGSWSRVPKVVAVVWFLWCLGGIVCALGVTVFAGQPGTVTVDVALVVSIRMVVLGGSVLLLQHDAACFAGRCFQHRIFALII
jgi:hypothetical protein